MRLKEVREVGEGEGRWTLGVQVPRALACQLKPLARAWHWQRVPTPFCWGDGAREARWRGARQGARRGPGPPELPLKAVPGQPTTDPWAPWGSIGCLLCV